MRSPAYRDVEETFLGKSFDYLVKNGLENISLRELCKGTGIPLGSIYYWFDGKDELIVDATEYGFRQVTDDIFSYVFSYMDNLEGFFDHCLEKVGEYEKELRFIYQMAASPVYGEQIRECGNALHGIYDNLADILAGKLHYSAEAIRPLVYIFIATVLDYIVWNDLEKTKSQLDYIYHMLPFSHKAAI